MRPRSFSAWIALRLYRPHHNAARTPRCLMAALAESLWHNYFGERTGRWKKFPSARIDSGRYPRLGAMFRGPKFFCRRGVPSPVPAKSEPDPRRLEALTTVRKSTALNHCGFACISNVVRNRLERATFLTAGGVHNCPEVQALNPCAYACMSVAITVNAYWRRRSSCLKLSLHRGQ